MGVKNEGVAEKAIDVVDETVNNIVLDVVIASPMMQPKMISWTTFLQTKKIKMTMKMMMIIHLSCHHSLELTLTFYQQLMFLLVSLQA